MEDGTKEITPRAFASALLSETYLPEGLKRIGYGAFVSSALKTIYITGTVEIIDLQAFGLCDQLETVAIGKGEQTIGKYAFERTTALKGVSVPESVKDIRELAFLGSGNVRIFTVENSFAHQLHSRISFNTM